MKKNLAEIIMNPVRQRIVQYLMLHQSGTIGDIAAELSDVPRTSIYRHMKILTEAGMVSVTGERAVRGAVEKTYALKSEPLGEYNQADAALLIQNTLMTLAASFAQYFDEAASDPVADMLSVTSSTLMLTDTEFMELLQKIGKAYESVIGNGPAEGRKPRLVTIVSSPTGGRKGE